MMFKLAETEQSAQVYANIRDFCSPVNVRQLVEYFVISDDVMKNDEQKKTVTELVRTMLDLVMR